MVGESPLPVVTWIWTVGEACRREIHQFFCLAFYTNSCWVAPAKDIVATSSTFDHIGKENLSKMFTDVRQIDIDVHIRRRRNDT